MSVSQVHVCVCHGFCVNVHECMHIHTYMCTRTQTNTHIHTHTHTCSETQTYTNSHVYFSIRSWSPWSTLVVRSTTRVSTYAVFSCANGIACEATLRALSPSRSIQRKSLFALRTSFVAKSCLPNFFRDNKPDIAIWCWQYMDKKCHKRDHNGAYSHGDHSPHTPHLRLTFPRARCRLQYFGVFSPGRP
jgi:hypothetical protein